MRKTPFSVFLRNERFLFVSLLTCAFFLWVGDYFYDRLDNHLVFIAVFVWLFVAVLGSAAAVVRHADHIALKLKEPYGTLLLTLSITSIEIMSITAVMLHGDNNPTLVRDTMFSVIMTILNGMVGLSLLIGSLKHSEQHYNLQGANTYLGVIIPLAVLSLVLPNFTITTPGPTLSLVQKMFLAVTSGFLYVAFLAIQTGRHRGYFTLGDEEQQVKPKTAQYSVTRHAVLLVVYAAPVVLLAKQLAHPIDYMIETVRWPMALGGLVVALLVATPEAIGAVRAAGANHMQRSVNIFLGSVLSTIGLTVPAMLAIGYVTGREIILGLQNADIVMLTLTLFVSIVTFASGRTNLMQGAVHLILFGAYILLIFQG